jgi:hypothetical protein
VLQLRKQPLGKIVFMCMMMRNSYCTLLGGQVSSFFAMEPPSLQHWTSQGPRARPLPDNCIWSDNYEQDDDEDDEDEEDVDDDEDD